MTLRTKLLLALAPVGVALALVCLLSVTSLSSLGLHSQAILQDNYRSVLAAQRMKEALERLEDQGGMFVLTEEHEEQRADIGRYQQQFEAELTVQEHNITEPGEVELTTRLRALWSRYQEKMTALMARRDSTEAKTFYFAELEPAFHDVRTTVEDILVKNQDAIVRKSDRVRHATEQQSLVMIGTASVSLSVGLWLSILLTNRLLRPLSVLSQTTQQLGEGDFAVRAHVQGTDELAHLARDFNAMASRLSEYRNSSLGELLQAQQASQAAIDSLPDPVVVFGVAGDVRTVNQAAETLLGLVLEPETTPDPLGKVEPAVRATLEKLRTHVLSGKGPYTPKGFEEAMRLSTRDGDHSLLARATPVYEPRGGIIGVTIVLQDVTRLHRFDELKNDLVATVAHEFRTPLTSLRMAIHLCLEQVVGPLTEKQTDLLSAAREESERLQGMVDDILDLSRIEAGRMTMHPQPVGVGTLVAAVVHEHRAAAEERGVEIRALEPTMGREVLADPARIPIVLNNLITNALRHTPRDGAITVHTQAENGMVRFAVTDTGPGLAPEHLPRLFEKFFRIPGTPVGGAGLGLSITKDIVEAHGGTVGVDSEVGCGTTFWFTLPCPPTNHAEDEATPARQP